MVRLTGWQGWDPLVACVVGVHIIVTGWRLLIQSFGRLMDEAEPELLERIVGILNEKRRQEWIDIHQLRTRRYGDKVHVDFHLILPRSYGLVAAHDHAERIEKAILDALDEVTEVIVHVDPCEDPLCKQCRQDPCEERSEENSGGSTPWKVEGVVLSRNHRSQKESEQ
jgi:divalent metal cation (Fe/Co/Zn/Cd) transporter